MRARLWDAASLVSRHRAAIAVFVAGAYFHLSRLDVWPSPAGDEMNWFELALDAHQGRVPHIEGVAAFVPPLFAYAVAAGFAGGSVDWWHARFGVAVAILVLAAVAYAQCVAAGRPRAGLFVLAWRLLTPWSIAWSRTTSVPYALATAIGTVGVLGFWNALDAPSPVRRAVGIVVSSQLLVLASCGSPLFGLWLVAAAIALLAHPRRARLLRSPGPWIAIAVAVVEIVPLVRSASAVAAAHHATWRDVTAFLGARLHGHATAILDGVDGTATLQHFVWGRCASPTLSTVIFAATRLATLGLLAATFVACLRREMRRREPWAPRAAILFVTALVGTPVLLAPARDWGLVTIDTDRYAFVWATPAALAVATLAERVNLRKLAAATALAWIVVPGAALWTLWHVDAAIDCGVLRTEGGAWRGMQVVAGPRGIPEWLAEATIRASAGDAPPLVVDDVFALRAVQISLRVRGVPNAVVFPEHAPDGTPALPDGRFLAATWPQARFARGAHWGYDEANARLRAGIASRDGRVVASAAQIDGTPLLEVWEVPARR